MKIETCEIDGLVEIIPDVFIDERGYFLESFNFQRYINDAKIFGNLVSSECPQFVQDNESFSQKGTLRGLHWQAEPYAQDKLVRVVEGHVWDVAVDLRLGSKTYGKWHGVHLTGENKKQFFIPKGFAHGFVALKDSVFAYTCTNYYNRSAERGLIWNDKTIAIDWPDSGVEPIISAKDLVHPTLENVVR